MKAMSLSEAPLLRITAGIPVKKMPPMTLCAT